MNVTITKKYTDTNKLAAQPWHSTLDEVQTYFQRNMRADITSESGFNTILNNEGAMSTYAKLVAGLVDNDPDAQKTVESVISNSCNDVANPLAVPRSIEASDALANNANYNALARMNAWLIVGYTARSKCLELYHTISSDEPNLSFTYNIDYVVRGNDKKKYFRPQADRDGDLGELYDLPMLAPAVKAGHSEKLDGKSTNGSDVWLKLTNNGIEGNFFDDNGEYSATKYTLEKNPKITGICYTITGSGDDAPSAETASGMMSVYFDRRTGTGEAQVKHFIENLVIPYTNAAGDAKSVSATIMGFVDTDSGDYKFTVMGPITHIQCDVRVTNVANELGTIRSGNINVTEDFSVDNHPYGTVPVVPEMSDDFNVGGQGVSAVAYFTDKVTSALANARDVTMEKNLDIAYQKGPEHMPLYNKLGGFAGTLTFPLTARMAGGGDPFSWMKTGLKESIIFHLSQAEMATYFEDDTPRQWYILGSDFDVNRIPDVQYSHITDNDGVGGADAKYGFQIKDRAGFMDSEGRRVRVIGSHYKRHYKDRNGNRLPMRAVLKSMDIQQPTSVYLPYSFRVYSGISSEYSKRTGLIVSARDCIKVMSTVQSRITLTGNSDALYGAICSNNSSAIVFPENTDTITIKATDE